MIQEKRLKSGELRHLHWAYERYVLVIHMFFGTSRRPMSFRRWLRTRDAEETLKKWNERIAKHLKMLQGMLRREEV